MEIIKSKSGNVASLAFTILFYAAMLARLIRLFIKISREHLSLRMHLNSARAHNKVTGLLRSAASRGHITPRFARVRKLFE